MYYGSLCRGFVEDLEAAVVSSCTAFGARYSEKVNVGGLVVLEEEVYSISFLVVSI